MGTTHQAFLGGRLIFSLSILLWIVFSITAFTGTAELQTKGNIELSIILGFGITVLILTLTSVIRSEIRTHFS